MAPSDPPTSLEPRPVPWIVWIVVAAILVGFGLLEAHALRPGVAPRPPEHVRAAEALELSVFLHPLCPCSRASLVELDRIVRASRTKLVVRAHVLSAPELATEAEPESLRSLLARLPGATIEDDPGGARARASGVETSGTILLYAADGTLLFDGGVTSARGHEGENASSDALLECIERGRGPRVTTPVFGCALFTSADRSR
jgi:hypothetical protein